MVISTNTRAIILVIKLLIKSIFCHSINHSVYPIENYYSPNSFGIDESGKQPAGELGDSGQMSLVAS